MSEEIEYLGETKPRTLGVLVTLGLLGGPGLAHVYVGKLQRGILVNLLVILVVEVFVIAFSLLKFFPLLPMVVILLGWITILGFNISSAKSNIAKDYVLRPFNHPLLYALVALFTFYGPLVATAQFTQTSLLGLARVDHSAMTPAIIPGDVVLFDRTSFQGRVVSRGEAVVLEHEEERPNILRAVAVPKDTVQVDGTNPIVNQTPLVQAELQPSGDDRDLFAVVEENFGSKYVVSVSKRTFLDAWVPPQELKESEYFLLADNRHQVPLQDGEIPPRDSRNFGPISADEIEGKPMYIAWSIDPETNSVRWHRIGLRLR